jgi:hypothetical protein
MVLGIDKAAKEKASRWGDRRCASARPRPRCCRIENARLGLATNFRQVAPRPKQRKPAEGIREMPSFMVKPWWGDQTQQGGGSAFAEGNSEGNDGEGETTIKIRGSKVRATTKGGEITSLTVSDPSYEISTTYTKGTDPSSQSIYGRGTTDEDNLAGNTSLEFHERQHRADYEQFVKDNPLPKPDVEVGMKVNDFKAALRNYDQQIKQYGLEAQSYTFSRTDCVGIKKSGC